MENIEDRTSDALRRFAWICLLLFATTSVSALEVQQTLWGFDGHAVPGRFNLFSVLISNPSDEPFDGSVKFYKSRGLADRVGAVYQNPCYLSSNTTRWLQFYVYVDQPYDEWRLDWGRRSNERQDIKAPKWEAPALVVLSGPDPTLVPVSAFRQFPEELFPPTIAGTSGLGALLLDHAPHWEPAKRQAFLDWLRAGGKVHLLMNDDGRFPVFSDELAVLNTSVERARIGAGLVVRHNATIRDIREQDVQDDEVPMRQFKPDEQAQVAQTSNSFFNALSELSQRKYSWGAIYLLAIFYIAIVGPANLRFARKLADYRLRIVLLLTMIAAFALLFDLVGRRGQGEKSVADTLAYARSIEGDSYDVMQWVNLFAAQSSRYTITHAAPHNIYATGQDYEPVNGEIENGKGGRFIVDMPMYSRRAFLHEAKMKGPEIPVKIVNWDGDTSLKQLIISVGPDFTKQVLDGWAIQGDQIYQMMSENHDLVFRNSACQPVAGFVSTFIPEQFENPYAPSQSIEVSDVEARFRKLAKPLIAWSLGSEDLTRLSEVPQQDNERVQLFLFARSPTSFGVTGANVGQETGYVLYHFDLFKPGS